MMLRSVLFAFVWFAASKLPTETEGFLGDAAQGRTNQPPHQCRTVSRDRVALVSMTKKGYTAINLPTVEELSTDDFMKQVSHSQKIVDMMTSDDDDDDDSDKVVDLLRAQLGHSDGIRGFFVTYLTMEGEDTPADQQEVPTSLVTAMKEASSKEDELVSLACMNVIMPTGMITMHKDPALSLTSQKTATRGIRVLQSLGRHKPLVKQECEAILAAANANETSAESVDDSKVKYWRSFFAKWGYKEIQRRDIAKAIESVLSA